MGMGKREDAPSARKFARKLSHMAARKGLSQTAISKDCGVTPQSVQRWFAGKSLPRAQHMPALAEALGVTIEELIEGVPELAEMMAAVDTINATREETKARELGSPAAEFALYALESRAFEQARRAYEAALSAAVRVAREHVEEALTWNGMAVSVSPTAGNTLTADTGSAVYRVVLRMQPPSPADAVVLRAYMEEAAGVGGGLVFAYPFMFAGGLHVLMLPATTLNPQRGNMEMLRDAARYLQEPTEDTPESVARYLDQFDLPSLLAPAD